MKVFSAPGLGKSQKTGVWNRVGVLEFVHGIEQLVFKLPMSNTARPKPNRIAH